MSEKFEAWGIVELMGHQRVAFRISADAHEADNYIAADVPAQDDPGNA